MRNQSGSDDEKFTILFHGTKKVEKFISDKRKKNPP